jgi:hypothetical protein
MRRSLLFSPTMRLSAVVIGMAVLAACTERPGPTAPTDSPAVAISPAGASFSGSRSRLAAVIIRNSGCVLFNGDGDLVFADRDISISTQSTRQSTTLICKAKNLANSTGRAVRYDSERNPFGPGTACGILRPDGFVVTTAWSETVSASGNATIRCHFKL